MIKDEVLGCFWALRSWKSNKNFMRNFWCSKQDSEAQDILSQDCVIKKCGYFGFRGHRTSFSWELGPKGV